METNSYGNWEKETKVILSQNFNGFLPKPADAKDYGQNYYHNYKQALLGDVNFIIYIEITLPNVETFRDFLSDYKLESIESRFINNEKVYFVQGNAESISEYLDDEIYDGMFYNFELVFVDESSLTVKFLSARVWDYYKDDFLCNFLSAVKE